MELNRRTAIQSVVFVAILVSPFALVKISANFPGWLIPNWLIPGWLIRTICIGFFCSGTILLLLIPFLAGVGWAIAALSKRGYLPGG